MTATETAGVDFENIVLIAADTVEGLRPSDVYRVLDSAKAQGCLTEMAVWLDNQTCTLHNADRFNVEIEQYLQECN